jgi:hypothetical protein
MSSVIVMAKTPSLNVTSRMVSRDTASGSAPIWRRTQWITPETTSSQIEHHVVVRP